MKFTRRAFIASTLAAIAAAGLVAPGHIRRLVRRTPSKPSFDGPNIILFIADDMRFDSMGCAGNKIVQTPNLDALAKDGVLFGNAFVTTSVCATSRACVYSGEYALNHRVYDFDTPMRKQSLRKSFFIRLRKAGYHTGFVGKWGVGGALPTAAFDQWKGFAGHGQYIQKGSDQHLTDRQTQQAIDFIRQKPDDKPFLLVVAYKAPHQPYRVQERFSELYKDAQIALDAYDTRDAKKQLPTVVKKFFPKSSFTPGAVEKRIDKLRRYYQMVTGVDDSIGQVIAYLREKGLADATSVIFTADNGMMLGAHGLWDKWHMFEESIRVPLIISPAKAFFPDIKPARATTNALNVDLSPTILDMASVKIPYGNGISLLPAMKNPETKLRDGFYYEFSGIRSSCIGYRTNKWKLARYTEKNKKGKPYDEFYDLENDPHELTNLIGRPEYREVLESVKAQMRAERKKLKLS